MLEDGRRPEAREVGLLCQRLPPVARVGHRAEQGGAQRGTLARLQQADRRAHRDQHQRERGQQAAGTTLVEVADPDPAIPAGTDDQQVGDQIAAEHEEDIDAEETAPYPGQALVERQDGQDRQRAHAVQARRPPGGVA